MQRSWRSAAAAAVFALVATGAVSAATSVCIQLGAAAAPAVLVIRDLPVPTAGAAITVSGNAKDLTAPAPLATLFVVGGSGTGTRERTLRAMVAAPHSVIEALQHDPKATLTVTVCPKGRPDACTTHGPFAASFVPHAE